MLPNMKISLFKKAHRYSKRIVIKNSLEIKEEDYKEVTKTTFLGALHLLPIDDEIEDNLEGKRKIKNNNNSPVTRINTKEICDTLKAEYANKEKENKLQKKSKTSTCVVCLKSFQDQSKYLAHRNGHKPARLLCKICGRDFENRTALLEHKQKHSGKKPYSCSKCQRVFKTLDLLVAHIRSHEGKLPYECKICKDDFSTYKAYNKHKEVHVLAKVNYPKVKAFKCENCPKEFRKLCDLERHTRVHTGEKPYDCIICHKRFQQAHNLTKHLIIHTNEKLHKCEVCGKKFGRSDVLNRHMITHSVDKPHHCAHCQKSFGRVSQLNDHSKKYHGVLFIKCDKEQV